MQFSISRVLDRAATAFTGSRAGHVITCMCTCCECADSDSLTLTGTGNAAEWAVRQRANRNFTGGLDSARWCRSKRLSKQIDPLQFQPKNRPNLKIVGYFHEGSSSTYSGPLITGTIPLSMCPKKVCFECQRICRVIYAALYTQGPSTLVLTLVRCI